MNARVSPQVLKPGTWPSAVRGRMPAQLLGEVMLGVLLVAALAFAPRDGVPVDDNFVWPAGSSTRFVASTAEEPSFGLTLPGVSNLSDRARAAGVAFTNQALVPTAPPAQLLIPALRVNRPVEGVGVDRWGVMDLPVNGWNAGWYKRGPTPGAPGDAVIEGHAGFPDQPMLFGKLATLRQGDKIIVVLADGSQRLFLVESMAVLPVGSAPPGMGEPYG
ncbi:MAG TPA: class F sortase, partial [Candidatus Dormibacteraeota bacterium]|nr:class F sortase [Candidatus Dormibacteraeota bacterium]